MHFITLSRVRLTYLKNKRITNDSYDAAKCSDLHILYILLMKCNPICTCLFLSEVKRNKLLTIQLKVYYANRNQKFPLLCVAKSSSSSWSWKLNYTSSQLWNCSLKYAWNVAGCGRNWEMQQPTAQNLDCNLLDSTFYIPTFTDPSLCYCQIDWGLDRRWEFQSCRISRSIKIWMWQPNWL